MDNETLMVPHPGEFIRDELEARGWTQRDLAYVLGVVETSVNRLLVGKTGVSADMAKALGEAFDVPAEFFLNLQKAYSLSRAKVPDPSVARKGKLQSSYPVREMIKRGWLEDSDATVLYRQMADFFQVGDPADIPYLEHAAKKTSPEQEGVTPPQLAWLYRVRQIALEMRIGAYSSKLLLGALDKLRALASELEEVRHVPKLLADCGVRFVLVEALPSSKIDGACFWIHSDANPVVGMSMRFDRIDNFWFVLRHELEHVLRRDGIGGKPVIDTDLDGGTSTKISEQEQIANAAAAEFCVPKAQLDSFYARKNPYFSEKDLLGFAKRLQVHPGLVAGQLRNRTQNWKLFAKHLVKVRHVLEASATVDGWGQIYPASPLRGVGNDNV